MGIRSDRPRPLAGAARGRSDQGPRAGARAAWGRGAPRVASSRGAPAGRGGARTGRRGDEGGRRPGLGARASQQRARVCTPVHVSAETRACTCPPGRTSACARVRVVAAGAGLRPGAQWPHARVSGCLSKTPDPSLTTPAQMLTYAFCQPAASPTGLPITFDDKRLAVASTPPKWAWSGGLWICRAFCHVSLAAKATIRWLSELGGYSTRH